MLYYHVIHIGATGRYCNVAGQKSMKPVYMVPEADSRFALSVPTLLVVSYVGCKDARNKHG